MVDYYNKKQLFSLFPSWKERVKTTFGPQNTCRTGVGLDLGVVVLWGPSAQTDPEQDDSVTSLMLFRVSLGLCLSGVEFYYQTDVVKTAASHVCLLVWRTRYSRICFVADSLLEQLNKQFLK